MSAPIVLIVDDEPANLAVLNQLLSPHYQVRVAKSGAKALELARLDPQPDLILLDVMMPDMDGYEVLGQLRADSLTQAIPVIFATALESDADEEVGLRRGAADYIIKPIKPAVTLERVKTQLEIKFARDSLSRQKEVLLREVHHRVKNNLNVIASLMNLHASGIRHPADAQAAFDRVRDRIMAMAAVHQELYESPDHGKVDMREFLDRLCPRLLGARPQLRSYLQVEVEDLALDVTVAVPCGLILNELVANCSAHAYPLDAVGPIVVRLSIADRHTGLLAVIDSGVGCVGCGRESAGALQGSNLGLMLVELWAAQIGGTFSFQSGAGAGATAEVRFPLPSVPLLGSQLQGVDRG